MTRSFLTCLAAVLFATSAIAQVPQGPGPGFPPIQPPPARVDWSKGKFLPPVEFDHPYPGVVRITRLASEDEVRGLCPGANFEGGGGRALACSMHHGNVVCVIYITSDELLATVGLDYDTVLRHEIGHCNGWNGHAGARYLKEDKLTGAPK